MATHRPDLLMAPRADLQLNPNVLTFPPLGFGFILTALLKFNSKYGQLIRNLNGLVCMSESERELQDFILLLSKSICGKLSDRFGDYNVESISEWIARDGFRATLLDMLKTWKTYHNGRGVDEKYDEIIAMLFIEMLGPLNKLVLSRKAPKAPAADRIVPIYFAALDRAFQHKEVRSKMTLYFEQALAA